MSILQCVISHIRDFIFTISFGIIIIDIYKWNSENNLTKNIKLINGKHDLWIENVLKITLSGHQLWTINTITENKTIYGSQNAHS